MGELTFITGPVRSGKSQRAVELATRWGSDTVFVATYQTDALDSEMMERVRLHRAYEDCGFQLVELVKSSVADRRRQVLDWLDAHQRRVDHG